MYCLTQHIDKTTVLHPPHTHTVLVKKVPGTLHVLARAEGHSFDHSFMNMTHVVHQLYFGSRPSSRVLWELKKL